MRLVLRSGDVTGLKAQLATTNAVALLEALGNAQDRQTVPWLTAVVTDETSAPEARRVAVRALVQMQEGAKARRWQLTATAGGPESCVRATGSGALAGDSGTGGQSIAAARRAQCGATTTVNGTHQTVRQRGEGADIFRRDTAGCIRCHQVRGEGGEVGPGLSEIGTKLPKEALYEALLEPSAGISFGFEAWQVQLKSGDEAYGIKASDTPEMVAIKDPGGIITRYPRKDIASMQQMKTSIMPSGLTGG